MTLNNFRVFMYVLVVIAEHWLVYILTDEMATYTCITCRVMFADKDGNEGRAAELQKEHYKTDWHRYNLKRKVADLPPVTAENFQQRVLTQKQQVTSVCLCLGLNRDATVFVCCHNYL